MSLLAHATYAARGLERERRALDKHIRDEVIEAKRMQKERGCSWSEALQLAYRVPAPSARRHP